VNASLHQLARNLIGVCSGSWSSTQSFTPSSRASSNSDWRLSRAAARPRLPSKPLFGLRAPVLWWDRALSESVLVDLRPAISTLSWSLARVGLGTKYGHAGFFTDRPPGKHPWSALQPFSPSPLHCPQDNINRLRDHSTAKIVRAGFHRLTSARSGCNGGAGSKAMMAATPEGMKCLGCPQRRLVTLYARSRRSLP
jgi:hypothetical protein